MALEGASATDAAGQGGQLALATERRSKGRLRWKGIDVSDEFRNYAERVARGEDLPPFTGKILAEPHPAFPWDPAAPKRAARRALRQQIGLWSGVLLFLGASVTVLVMQVRRQADVWQAPKSPLDTVAMANQPRSALPERSSTADDTSSPSPQLDLGESAGSENAPAAFSELVEPAPAGAADRSGDVASPSTTAVARPAPAVVPPPVAAPRPAAPAKAAAAAAPSPSLLAATRPAEPPSAAVTSTSSEAAAASEAMESEPALTAVATGGTSAGGSFGASSGSDADPTSALRADPKKEPAAEASGMGSLLVESPSF